MTTRHRAPERHAVVRCALLAAWLGAGGEAAAQPPDLVLLDGKVVTVDAQASLHEALAIRDGKISGLGSTAEIRRLAGPDHARRRARRPHGHPGAHRLASARRARCAVVQHRGQLDRRAVAARSARRGSALPPRSRPPGSWLIVAGGWNELQFAERRRPTQAELEAAAPDNPVYVQLGYGWAVMTDDGLAKLGIRSDADLPAGGTLERDGERLTGAVSGGQAAIIALFDRLPKPTFAEQVQGTREFFRELNRLGLTGVVDPGGNNLFPPDYQALFDVWRRGELTVRVRLQLERPDGGRGTRRAQEPHGAAADGLRRRPAALQRARRAHHLCDEQQPRADGRAQGAVLRDRALGGRARDGDHDALGPRRHGRAPARHLRAREPRGADRAAALVDRALERRVGGDAAAHERARHRLDGAGRDVLRRRGSRAPARRRTPRAAFRPS